MEENKIYTLPSLPFGYKDLEPYISEEQLTIHHQKHHQGYVNNANAILEKIEKFRKENSEFDAKAILRDLSFNVGGHILHSLFWKNLRPASAKENNSLSVFKTIEKDFGSMERFKGEFSKAALSVEGSGWGALVLDKESSRLLLMQIEKHSVNIYPNSDILLVLDVWEHAYYLDYKNERGKFIDAFWNIVNWEEVQKRFEISRR